MRNSSSTIRLPYQLFRIRVFLIFHIVPHHGPRLPALHFMRLFSVQLSRSKPRRITYLQPNPASENLRQKVTSIIHKKIRTTRYPFYIHCIKYFKFDTRSNKTPATYLACYFPCKTLSRYAKYELFLPITQTQRNPHFLILTRSNIQHFRWHRRFLDLIYVADLKKLRHKNLFALQWWKLREWNLALKLGVFSGRYPILRTEVAPRTTRQHFKMLLIRNGRFTISNFYQHLLQKSRIYFETF